MLNENQLLIKAIISSTDIKDLFGDNWKKDFRLYIKKIHPDVCMEKGAKEAVQKLNDLKDKFENGNTIEDESGSIKYFDKKIIFTGDKSLLDISFKNYNHLIKLINTDTKIFYKYFPKNMRFNDNQLIVEFNERSIPLTNLKLDNVHVNWIYSRILELACWLRQEGFSHNGFNPESIFIVPETHGIICTSFFHMVDKDSKLNTISAKYQNWYPYHIFDNKIATEDIDIYMAKRLAIYLLGDQSGSGVKLKVNKDIDTDILNYFINNNTVFGKNAYAEYRDLIQKNFKKKFYKLEL